MYTIDAYSNRLQNIGVKYVEFASAPDSSDYQFPRGTVWLDSSTSHFYWLSDNSTNDAVWQDISQALYGDAQESVLSIADCTAVPPTEVLGDRYILDETGGAVNAAWDGATKKDIVQFNGATWQSYTPNEGWIVEVEDEDLVYTYLTSWVSLGVAIAQATESARGTAELATQAETIAYTNDTNIVTPLKLGQGFAAPAALGSTTPAAVSATTITTTSTVGVGEASPVTQMEMTGTAPYLTIHNSTEEDGNGGREGKVIFRGEQSGGEETVLGEIEFAHDGASDDEKGRMVIRVNDGNDGTSPTDRITLASDGATTLAGNFSLNKTDGFLNMYDSTADTYPMIQLWHNAHDDIYMYFDSYDSGGNKSSDAGSNFRLSKYADVFSIQYSSGNAQGAAVSFSNALAVSNAGTVTIGTVDINGGAIDGTTVGATTPAAGTFTGLKVNGTAPANYDMYTSADGYPSLEILNYGHDNVALCFDTYFTPATFKSSDAGSNFYIYKNADKLTIYADSGNAQGVSLSPVNAMQVIPTGEILFPSQPAFQARLTTDVTDVTGDGTVYQMIFTTETFDRNADYNSATGVFTAPVSGTYKLDAILRIIQLGAGHTTATITISTSNRDYPKIIGNIGAMRDANNVFSPDVSCIADMDANDTAYVTINVYNSTKTVDIQSNATDARSSFSGWLLG